MAELDLKSAGQLQPGLGHFPELALFGPTQGITLQVPVRQRYTGKQTVPALDDVIQRPGIGGRLIHIQNHMGVVAHHGIGTDRHREGLGQIEQTLLYPVTAVLEGTPGGGILATQEGPAHATGDTQ